MAHLAAIVASSDDAIISKDLDGRIQTWNSGAQHIFGYSAEEAIGQLITLIIPADRLDEEKRIMDTLKRGDRVDHFETIRLAKDGRRIDVSLTVSPVRDAAGVVIGASKIARDITERKQAEQLLLERENALLEAARRKDEFLALLGHELRNPLAPIRNASELLARILADNSRADAPIAIIKRQIAQLAKLVDDLLDLGRITHGRIQLQIEPIDLARVVAQAIETVEPQFRQKHHRVSITSSYEALYVEGDFARLVQCVTNVLCNSAKYTEVNGEIRLQTRREGSYVVVEVTDTGVGIAPELIPDIFDLFVQGGRTLDRAEGGLGIGLSLVKRLIEMHGGEVTAISPGIGLGSTFQLRLTGIPSPKPSEGHHAVLKQPQSLRILVVDDNEDSANSLALLLTWGGHATKVAHSAPEALACIEGFGPDVLI
ncbi:MAG: PAS domain-containing hybrid sensor histidine kinase/response regulator [Steroidobacteraceae bacterium]